MRLGRVAVMDFDPHGCPEDHGQQLAGLLCKFASTQTADVCTITCFPPEALCPPPDLILLRPAMSASLSAIVQDLRHRWQTTPILGLVCTSKDTPAAVQQFLLNEVEDFLSCPLRDIDVFPRVQRLLHDTRRAFTTPPAAELRTHPALSGLVGESIPFMQVVEKVIGVAHCDITVLISGETGTGKELMARAIHYHSPRQGKPFVPVNCGALPEHLAENELFGHVKGAFTDASSPEQGLVAEAEGGTLFLDEIDALSPAVQVKLLRFLQDREYRPLGCSKSKTADVRIVIATNTDLWLQVQAKQFRADLYYRLNMIALRLPSLRERTADIPLLAHYFLSRYGKQYDRSMLSLSTGALHKLAAYAWPGNVRELETVIQRAVVLASATVLQPEDIDLPAPHGGHTSEADSFHKAKARCIEQFERAYLSDLLAIHQGNITRAAKQAGKERRAFQRLLHKHSLHRGAFHP